MHYVILDSTGNLVASFDDAAAAMAAMGQLGSEDEEAIGELAMITYDDEGVPVGDGVILSDEHLAHATMTLADQTQEGQTAYFPVATAA